MERENYGNRHRFRVVLSISCVVCIWSLAAAVEVITLRGLSPIQFSAWCTASGSGALIVAVFLTGKTKNLLAYRFRDHLNLILLSLFGFAGYQILKFTAFTMVPVPQANILQYSYPIFIVIFAMPVLKQHLTFTKTVSIVMGFAGAAIILSGGSLTALEWAHFGGYALALCAGASFGLFSVCATRAAYEPVTSMFFMQVYSAVMVFCLLFITGSAAYPSDLAELAGVFFSGVLAHVVGVIMLISAQQSTSDVSYISGALYLIPFLSLFAFKILLDIPVPFYAFTGLAFIVGGMVFHTVRS